MNHAASCQKSLPRATDVSALSGKDKEKHVQTMFNRIAGQYDRLNRLISLGGDRRWRRLAVGWADLHPGATAVDLGTGTGDLYLELIRVVEPGGQVIGLDVAEQMLAIAGHKAGQHFAAQSVAADHQSQAAGPWEAKGRASQQHPLRLGSADSTELPEACADAVTMGWVLRNVGDRIAVYQEVLRILKPGGRFVCLDMSQPQLSALRWGSRFYLDWMMPTVVKLTGGDPQAYRYLANSTARFPSKAALADEWRQAGFVAVRSQGLALGAIGLHVGQKPK